MYPLIISDLPIQQLLDAIHQVTGTPFQRVPAGQKEINRDDGEPLIAGEVDGRSYLLDLWSAMIASLRSPLAKIAVDFDCLLVATAHDRTELQCEFFVAQGGKLCRLYWHNATRTTKDFTVGEPLATELDFPLSNPDGSGLTAALQSYGFRQMDYTKGFQRVPGDFVLTWKGDALELLKQDALSQQIDDHVRMHPNPHYRGKIPGIRLRPMDD